MSTKKNKQLYTNDFVLLYFSSSLLPRRHVCLSFSLSLSPMNLVPFLESPFFLFSRYFSLIHVLPLPHELAKHVTRPPRSWHATTMHWEDLYSVRQRARESESESKRILYGVFEESQLLNAKEFFTFEKKKKNFRLSCVVCSKGIALVSKQTKCLEGKKLCPKKIYGRKNLSPHLRSLRSLIFHMKQLMQ